MKIAKFVFFLIVTVAVTLALNIKIASVPPLGKFLDPLNGFWQNSEYSAISAPEELHLSGLQKPVSVYWDKDMVPHIVAQTDHDLYMAQGYVMAFHRLWQMEFQLYKTAGRLSEILGPITINMDRQQRRKGLAYSANWLLQETQKDSTIYAMLQAYSDGVNAYINSLGYKNLPIEYKLLNYEPELFTPFKTCLLLKEMSDQLSSGEMDLENTNLVRLLGKEMFNFLFPDRDPGIDPIISAGTKFNYQAMPAPVVTDSFPSAEILETIEKPDPKNGSNNFVVSGSKTASGNVILANEPDLGLNLPSLWYITHLQSPAVNTMGVVFPGAPGIIIGFTDSIAFGFTNAKRDVADWFFIEFKDSRRKEYLYDGKWMKTQRVLEQINVRGEDAIIDTVIYTHYGPVVYDRNFKGNGQQVNFAFRWTAHDPSRDIRLFYELNRGRNLNDFKRAVQYWTGPPQNISYGDVYGNIAIWVQGKFPLKFPEQGKFLMDGRSSRFDWSGWVPHEHNLNEVNPVKGFVSSANQHPADESYPYYVYDYNYEFYRNRRINDRLKLMQNIKPDDMMRLQNDNYNYMAADNLHLMLDSLDTAIFDTKQWEVYNTLRTWDYFNEAGRVAPVYFEAWWDNFYSLLWDEFDTMSVAVYKPNTFHTTHLMKNNAAMPFTDRVATPGKESFADLVELTFISAIDSVESWQERSGKELTWSNYKNTTLLHLLRLRPFSVEGVEIGGNHGIVNAAGGRHGPSFRMVVELDKAGVKAWGVYPGSQSGNPGNPHWGNLIEPWAKGNYLSLMFTRDTRELAEKAVLIQTFKPSN